MNQPERPNRAGESLLLFPALLAAGMLVAACAARADELGTLRGWVVDAAGMSAAGASVWIVGGEYFEDIQTIARATTDAQGRFALPGFWSDERRRLAHSRVLSIIARDRDARLGWLENVQHDAPGELVVELMEGADVEGRLVDHEDNPIVGAEVAPQSISPSYSRFPRKESIHLGPEIAALYSRRSAVDGSFKLKGMPGAGSVYATIGAPGFARATIELKTHAPATIVLDGRLGQIRGRVVPPEGRRWEGRLLLHLGPPNPGLDLDAPRSVQEEAPSGTDYSATTLPGGDGTFQFDGVPPGKYEIRAETGPGVPLRAEPLGGIEVAPGSQVAGLELPLRPLLLIRGRVVDAVDGHGIAGVEVSSYHLEGDQRAGDGGAVTDAEGRYRIAVRPGMTLMELDECPVSHLLLPTEYPRQEARADQAWPDLALPRAAAAEGIVVDGQGRPVPLAEVTVRAPKMFGPERSTLERTFKVGSEGRFRIEQVAPEDNLTVRARTREAVTEGITLFRPKDLRGPIKVSLIPEQAFLLRGIVQNHFGRPIMGARVYVYMIGGETPRVSSEFLEDEKGSILESYATDARGEFRSDALWPDSRYKVAVYAPDCQPVDSSYVGAKAGATHDYGTFTPAAVNGYLAGIVVDSAGQRLAGVTVFNRGDGYRSVTAQTDDEGQFRLDGLYAGGKYLFAQHAGFRFTRVRAGDDSDELRITLLRSDEAPPAWNPKPSVPYEAQRDLARKLLIKLWERFGGQAETGGVSECVALMARIDPELARQWSARAGGRYDAEIQKIVARDLTETDPEAALKLVEGARRFALLTKLAEQRAGTHPDQARALAEEAAVQARVFDPDERLPALAQAGALLIRLGRAEAGKKLIDEAAEAAERLPLPGKRQIFNTRSEVAAAIALVDLDRALGLIEPLAAPPDQARDAQPALPLNTFDVALRQIVRAIARSSTPRALALADRTRFPDGTRAEIACRIAAEQPDEAVRIIESLQGDRVADDQAEAFAKVALAIAPRDPTRAHALIDRALALPIERPEAFMSHFLAHGGTAKAAWIAACARRTGYPDMDSVIARVLASRSPDERRWVKPRNKIHAAAEAALVLALTDPGAAVQLLHDTEARSGAGAAEFDHLAGPCWLAAWALADPERAEQLFDTKLATLAGQTSVDLKSINLFGMIMVLTIPPQRREEETGLMIDSLLLQIPVF